VRRGLALVVILVLAAALRVYHLGTESVWLDEAASVEIAHDPPIDVIRDTVEDVHPPLYYLLLHAWIGRVGDSERAIRSLSVLLSLLAVLAVAGFAGRWFGRETALVAALLAAFAPLQIAFAQEARMYALLTLTALLSVDGCLRAVRSGTPRAVAAFALATTAMLYTHVYGFFVLAAELAWLGGLFVASPASRARWRPPAVGVGLAVLGFLPWLPSFLTQLHGVEHAFWIPPNATLGEAFAVQAGSPLLGLLAGLLIVGALVVTWRQARRTAGDAGWSWAAASLAAAVVVAVLGVPYWLSRISTPIYLPKYTIAASLPFLALVARGLVALGSRPRQAVAVIVLAALTVSPLTAYFGTRRKDNWRTVVAGVEGNAEPGDLVVFSQAFGVAPFHYYARRTDLVELPFLDVWEGLTRRSLTALAGVAVGPYDRVWLIVSDPDPPTAALGAALVEYRRTVVIPGGGVEARLYTRISDFGRSER
jgi:mannosyltransferase